MDFLIFIHLSEAKLPYFSRTYSNTFQKQSFSILLLLLSSKFFQKKIEEAISCKILYLKQVRILLQGVVMWQQPWAFLFLCQILSHYMTYSYSKTLTYGKKTPGFSQDVFNKHGFVCTRLYIRISWFLFWSIDLEGVVVLDLPY